MSATNLLPPFKPSLPLPAPRQPTGRSSTPPSSWWTPLFGWPSQPAYLDAVNTSTNLKIPTETPPDKAGPRRSSASRPRSVQFTEEKARLLRKMTTEVGSFHHEMYHSAIAARLASDFGVPKSDQ
ncbi:hypothetical protein MLD38_005742 [Melastoma candidum]|uniref:Uncharacterized protein n=1 Tax=Melastoma candidum TaxID=119954 RepID=A0ACB9RPB3_9MYRT|nr:hypothetical protein MLD38_005742 [Melastoma candidum]